MSLRDTLKATVARCVPLDAQRATSQDANATGTATPAQQPPAIPHGIRIHAATAIATAMQPGRKESATRADSGEKLRVAFASTRNTQQGALTAHRMAKELIAAAMKVSDLYGDDKAAREEMRRDVQATEPHLMPDLLDYLQSRARGRAG